MANEKQILVGFDGYIDKILKPIDHSNADETIYFRTLKDFSSYLLEKSENSHAIQMDLIETRIGGNAPILVGTLRNLLNDVILIGMLGDLEKDENPFLSFLKKGENYSFMDPIETLALEFSDAKLFLSSRGEKNTYKNIFNKIISIISNHSIFNEVDLLAFVNWGEIDFSQSLWKQIFDTFIEPTQTDKSKYVFIDTADISRHSKSKISNFCMLVKNLSLKRYLCLGLNANEFKILCKHFYVLTAKELFDKLEIDELILHSKKASHIFTNNKEYTVDVKLIKSPAISTGAGDNFNAGYIYGLLNNKSYDERLKLANSCSHYYMTKGYPVDDSKTLETYKNSLYPNIAN